MLDVSVNNATLICGALILMVLLVVVLSITAPDKEDDTADTAAQRASHDFVSSDLTWFCHLDLIDLGLDWLLQHWKTHHKPAGDMLEVYYLIIFLGDPQNGRGEAAIYNAYAQAVTQASANRAYRSLINEEQRKAINKPQVQFELLPEVQTIRKGLSYLNHHYETNTKKFDKVYVLQLLKELAHLPLVPSERAIYDAFIRSVGQAETILAEKTMLSYTNPLRRSNTNS